jgi:hypothetical protein
MAVLSDEQQGWRPTVFEQGLWGCQMSFKFPTVKLLNYRNDWAALEKDDNPFATVVMAHLKAQETRHDDEKRAEWKLFLIRRLYERGYEREDVLNLFRFIDWVMTLPEGAEEKLWQEIRECEEEKQMTYMTSIERIGFKKGIQEGRQEGIREGLLAGIKLGLKLKFGSVGLRLLPEIYKIEDVDMLRAIHEGLETATTMEELRQIYQPAPSMQTYQPANSQTYRRGGER